MTRLSPPPTVFGVGRWPRGRLDVTGVRKVAWGPSPDLLPGCHDGVSWRSLQVGSLVPPWGRQRIEKPSQVRSQTKFLFIFITSSYYLVYFWDLSFLTRG